VRQIKTFAAFGLVVACGVAGAGLYKLLHRADDPAHQPNSPVASHDGGQASAPQSSNVQSVTAATDGTEATPSTPIAQAPPSEIAAAEPHHTDPAPEAPASEPPTSAIAAQPRTETTFPAPDPRRMADEMAEADDDLRHGDWASAHKKYSNYLNAETSDLVLMFRDALCMESLGLLDDAAECYQLLAKRAPTAAWKGFARWGLARVLFAKGHTNVALRHGCELWLNRDRTATLWQGELAHWLGHQMYHRALATLPSDLLLDNALASCSTTVRTADLIAYCNEIHAAELGQNPGLLTTGARSVEDPDRSLAIRLETGQITIREAIIRVAAIAGWTLEWAGNSEELARVHVCSASVTAAPEALLDALCEPTGLDWRLNEGAVSVVDASGQSDESRNRHELDMASRFLLQALALDTSSRWTCYSQLGLAQIAAARGEMAVAQKQLENLVEGNPRSGIVAEAWFDLGKLRYRNQQHGEAIAAFRRCVDHSSGTLEPIANMYLGRLLLESDDARKAVIPLRRAAALATGRTRPQAIMALAGAHLAAGRPEAAHEVLRASQPELAAETSRDAAAFLSTFSQVRAAQDSYRLKYDRQNLLSAVSHVHPADFFGSEGGVLIVEAYDELGLPGEADAVCRQICETLPACPIRHRLELKIADHARQNGDLARSEETYRSMARCETAAIRLAATQRLCDQLLSQTRLDDAQLAAVACLNSCEESADQLAALRLLGRCLEQKGDRINAALCFAGAKPELKSPVP
jgi:tetratricopeptide (TPR) repeat protein